MVIILCYHKISDAKNDYNLVNVTPYNFEQQIRYLSSQHKIVSLEDLNTEMYERNEYIFAITFDDGYRDVYNNALPILEKFNVPATVFVTTENLDTCYENWTDNIMRAIFEPADRKDYFECSDCELEGKWYTRDLEEKTAFYRKINYLFRHVGKNKREKYESILLDWAGLTREGRNENRILSVHELKELSKSPLISIGSHCVTHPSLAALTAEEQEQEICNSITRLKEIIGLPIRYMAYPFGSRTSYNAITIELLKSCGIEMAFTTIPERVTIETDPYQMPRIVMGNYNIEDFKTRICDIISRQKKSLQREKENPDSLYYVGNIERDMRLIDGEKHIVVWGCGFWGKCLYDDLKLLNLHERIVAYGDNDLSKAGQVIHGVPVLSKSDIMKQYKKEDLVILVKNAHDLEICNDLMESGFNEIHLLVR